MSEATDPIADLRKWDYCWPGNVNLEHAVQEAIAAFDRVTAERDALEAYIVEAPPVPADILQARAEAAESALRVAREALADIRDSWPQDAKDLAKAAIDTIDALIPTPKETPDVA